jgi:hypothetical protein
MRTPERRWFVGAPEFSRRLVKFTRNPCNSYAAGAGSPPGMTHGETPDAGAIYA